MSEQEWMGCDDPVLILRGLRGRARARGLRLFTVSCIRDVGHLLWDDRLRGVYFALEESIEGGASRSRLAKGNRLALDVWQELRGRDSFWREVDREVGCKIMTAHRALVLASEPSTNRWEQAVRTVAAFRGHTPFDEPEPYPTSVAWQQKIREKQVGHLRDIFGRGSLRKQLDKRWQNGEGQVAVRIAETIYEERMFDEVPVLGDALIDTDCPHRELIEHCHSDAKHGRGCWAIDWLLGKK